MDADLPLRDGVPRRRFPLAGTARLLAFIDEIVIPFLNTLYGGIIGGFGAGLGARICQ